MPSIAPGATIGILGGGQLGRMTAMAARSFGYRVQALDPDPSCPAQFVVDSCFAAEWDDLSAVSHLARGCDVVTLEIEKIPIASLETAAKYAPVRPSQEILAMVQDRAAQKSWLRDQGFPLGPFRVAASETELAEALAALGGKCFVKASRGGYDGRGQVETHSADAAEAARAWSELRAEAVVAEQALDLELEISVMVARRPSGETATFPAALNHHERRILAWSVIPAPVEPRVAEVARGLATGIADSLRCEGLLAIEMFLTRDGKLLVNELAPRPHNSFHATERACVTSQFEQHVRSVCDLPLGSVDVLRPAAIVNLLGDLWLARKKPDFDSALAVPGVRLHLYEKRVPRAGRKMGHLSGIGSTPEEAVRSVQLAFDRLAL